MVMQFKVSPSCEYTIISFSKGSILMQKSQNVSDTEAGKDGVRRRRFLRATSYQGTSEGSII